MRPRDAHVHSMPTGILPTLDPTPLDGLRTIVVVNGVKVTDYKEGDPTPPRKLDYEPIRGPRPEFGYFGLQNESDKNVVYFREVALKKQAGGTTN